MTRSTYTITDPHRCGEVIALVTDALTGRTRAVVLDSLGKPFDVIVGEPLCEGCDEPVSDGPCSCEQIRRELGLFEDGRRDAA